MDAQTLVAPTRRPRFRRASEPPAFRLTDDDIVIIRQLARYRFLRSTHIAALIGRSLDRTNDRLSKLYHAGYLDRPRAQLDYYPTSGSAPIAYALADRGARLMAERGGIRLTNLEWSRKNREAGRAFIEHQLEIIDFYVALQRAAFGRRDIRVIHPDEIVAAFPDQRTRERHPFALRVKLAGNGIIHSVAVVPDLAFGLQFADGTRHHFMVEIDRGTMPIIRSDFTQTSFARKMRAYLAAHAGKQHERQFGWKNFRVLTITTDQYRKQSMMDASREIRVPHSSGPQLFLFATREELYRSDPLTHAWSDGNERNNILADFRGHAV